MFHSTIKWDELYWTPQKMDKVYKNLCIKCAYSIIKNQCKLLKTAMSMDDIIIWSNPAHLKKSKKKNDNLYWPNSIKTFKSSLYQPFGRPPLLPKHKWSMWFYKVLNYKEAAWWSSELYCNENRSIFHHLSPGKSWINNKLTSTENNKSLFKGQFFR